MNFLESIGLTGIPLLFIYFVIVALVIRHKLKKAPKESTLLSFMEQDIIANSTRLKELPPLAFITIPKESIPEVLGDDELVYQYEQLLSTIELPSVYFERMTNIELKMKFGTNHFNQIVRYEGNYTRLIRALYEYSKALYQQNHFQEAFLVSRIAFENHTDITKHLIIYFDLIKYQPNQDELAKEAHDWITQSNPLLKDQLFRALNKSLENN